MSVPKSNENEMIPRQSSGKSASSSRGVAGIGAAAVAIAVAGYLVSKSFPLALVIVGSLVAGAITQFLFVWMLRFLRDGKSSNGIVVSSPATDTIRRKSTDDEIRRKIENMGFRSGKASVGGGTQNAGQTPLEALKFRFGEIHAELEGAERYQALLDELAECVLDFCGIIAQAKLCYNAWKADATAGAEFVISVGFSRDDLANWFSIRPETAVEGIRQALEDFVCNALGTTEQDKTDIRCCLKWEVWSSQAIKGRDFVWNVKQVVPNGKRVKYVAYIARDAPPLRDGNVPAFNQWSWKREGGWSSWQTKFLLGSEERDFVVGPRDERCPTALIDFYHPDLSFTMKFPQIFAEKGLQKNDLYISMVEEVNPFITPHDTVIRELKGTVRLKGYWRQGQWQPSESFQLRGEGSESFSDARQRYEGRLSTAAPNRLLKAVGDALDVVYGDRQNRILADVLNRAEAPLGSALFEAGNFTIYRERRDQSAFGEPSPSIWVMERMPGAVTEFFVPALGDDRRFEQMSAYGDPPVPDPTVQRIPLFFKDSFFVKTGGADPDGVHLCLEFDLGSPALGQGVQGMTTFSEESPKLTLEAFARRKGVEGFEHLDSKSAQGFLARGRLPASDGRPKMVYFKLIEAAHLKQYYTGSIFKTLQKAGVIPREVQEDWCNGHGQSVKDGAIMVFSTPEYRTVSELLLTGTLDSGDRRLLCRQLALFSQRVLELGVVCTDFSLDDTMIVPSSLPDFRSAARDTSDKPCLFVADYGAYCQTTHFSVQSRIFKGQYQTPEDIDSELTGNAESTQVFLLGALFLEVLLGEPGQVPRALLDLREHQDADRFRREVSDQVAKFTGTPMLVAWRELVVRMFEYRPEDRPRLDEVLNHPVLES